MKRPNAFRSFGYSRAAISDVLFTRSSSMLSSSNNQKERAELTRRAW
jgi:hypothetical protein